MAYGFGGAAHSADQGWLSRLRGAFKAMFGGIVLLLVAFGLQFWNEGRTHRRDALLADVRAAVATVEADAPVESAPALVHVSGDAVAAAPVVDAGFGASLPALALRRRVEMYQWVERRDKRKEQRSGGSERSATGYRYEKRWKDEPVDSSRFEHREGHENPGPFPYRDAVWRADDVRVGAYVLAPELVRELPGWERVDPARIELPPNLAASFRVDGNWFTTSPGDEPEVGDVRVRFDAIPGGTVSIVAAREGARLVPHRVGEDSFVLVERGAHGMREMLERAGRGNSRTGWVLRLAGLVIAWVGFGVLLRPLVVLADVVPLLGRVAGFGTFVVSGILAALFSVLGVGSGWIWSRPWLLGLMLAAIVAAIVLVALRARRTTLGPPAPPPMPPPPPPPPTTP